MDTDYYYDYEDYGGGGGGDSEYPDSDTGEFPYLTQEAFEADRSLKGTFYSCVQPSILQTSGYVGALLGLSLLCRCVCRLSVRREWLQHSVSLLCGFAALYTTTGHDFLIVVFLSLLSYVLMLLVEYYRRNMGVIVAIATVVLHFLYELLWDKPEAWQRIRGVQMVATMKIISLAFDLEAGNTPSTDTHNKHTPLTVPAVIPYLGYVFCPYTCVLGPWLPYKLYRRGLRTPESVGMTRALCWSMLNAVLAVVFLSLSNCIVPLLCTDNTWIGFRVYRDALAVRCSHYFICFLSQSTVALSGLRLKEDTRPNPVLGHLVTKPWRIEWPRSLSSLVRYWNIPMHDWLKCYIYRPAYKRIGNYFTAIVCTYFVSALLHGVYAKIYLVLLSLGFFAYVENVLRASLASIFDACIGARRCRKPCPFKHCPNKAEATRHTKITVLAVNILFSEFAIFHLAYLGVMMNDEKYTAGEEHGNLWIWAKLNYLSHWIALITYAFHHLM